MGILGLCAVGVVLALGLAGVLLPGVPGLLLCWAGVLWWALSTRGQVAWAVLIGCTVVLVVSQMLRVVLPGERIRHKGDSRVASRLLVAAAAGGLVGFCVVPVLGGIPGCYAGLFVAELARLRDVGNARMSARAAIRRIGTPTLVEYFAAMLVAATWLVVVFTR